MKKITVKLAKTYDIIISADILDTAGSLIRETVGADNNTAAIITDDNVSALYEQRLTDTLVQNNYRVVRYVFKSGELAKNAETFLEILNFLATEKLNRRDVVVALGGGVVGDLAGFAAACYMRGMKFVQVPTTLLAMVDSSVGGKTGINLSAGKNLAGAFYQPHAVICDVSALSTLPDEEFTNGCAEVIKYGVIADKELFELIKKPIRNNLENIISRCATIKRDIVTEDEYETGIRKLLNFGHTIGHAIELLSNYKISHGSAVAIGMAIETRAAVKAGICKPDCLEELLHILAAYNLPCDTNYNVESLANACLSDKKRGGDTLTMIFPTEIGKCILKEIPVNEIKIIIQSGLET